MRLPMLLAATLVLALTAACDGDPKPSPQPSPSASPSPTEDPTPPATALARLAGLGAKSAYSATYVVKGTSPGTARIFRTRNGYRFELTTGLSGNRRKAVLIRTTGGTVSCTVAPTPVTCLFVAGPGKPVPAVFDAGLQHVFSDYLIAMSKPSSSYEVTNAETSSPGDGSCFAIASAASAPPANAVAAGTYCFADDGVVTRVTYPSGEVVLSSRGKAPTAKDFLPPAKPKGLS